MSETLEGFNFFVLGLKTALRVSFAFSAPSSKDLGVLTGKREPNTAPAPTEKLRVAGSISSPLPYSLTI